MLYMHNVSTPHTFILSLGLCTAYNLLEPFLLQRLANKVCLSTFIMSCRCFYYGHKSCKGYGVFSPTNCTILRRPTGGSKCRTIKSIFKHRIVLGEVRCYLKLHGALTVGLLRLKLHRPVTVLRPTGTRPAYALLRRAPDDFDINLKSYDWSMTSMAPDDVCPRTG